MSDHEGSDDRDGPSGSIRQNLSSLIQRTIRRALGVGTADDAADEAIRALVEAYLNTITLPTTSSNNVINPLAGQIATQLTPQARTAIQGMPTGASNGPTAPITLPPPPGATLQSGPTGSTIGLSNADPFNFLQDYFAANPNASQQFSDWQAERMRNGQSPNDWEAMRQHFIALGSPDPGAPPSGFRVPTPGPTGGTPSPTTTRKSLTDFIQANLGAAFGDPNYNPAYDLNSDDVINALDYSLGLTGQTTPTPRNRPRTRPVPDTISPQLLPNTAPPRTNVPPPEPSGPTPGAVFNPELRAGSAQNILGLGIQGLSGLGPEDIDRLFPFFTSEGGEADPGFASRNVLRGYGFDTSAGNPFVEFMERILPGSAQRLQYQNILGGVTDPTSNQTLMGTLGSGIRYNRDPTFTQRLQDLQRRYRTDPTTGTVDQRALAERSLDPAEAWRLYMMNYGGDRTFMSQGVQDRINRRLLDAYRNQAGGNAGAGARSYLEFIMGLGG